MIEGPLLPPPPSLLAAFARNAALYPQRDALRFLEKGEAVTASIGFAALLKDVEEVAAGLVERGLTGRPVVVALPPGIGFLRAFLACLRAGAIAVPVPFPPYGQTADRLEGILADAGAAAVLTERGGAGAAPAAFAGRRVLTLDELPEAANLPAAPPPEAPALIQYSSGSTRDPAGIVVTHGNIAANLAMVQALLGLGPGLSGVSWLPPSHDMGLGAILQPLFVGSTGVAMPPAAFMQRPLRWLRAIQDHGASVAGGPNFGYDLCLRRVPPEAVMELDLQCWQIAFCGAEPIRAATLERFARHLAPSGFSRAALFACYGLAEATLLATGGRLRELPPAPGDFAFSRVSCGRAAPGCSVTLAGTEAGGIGEVFLAGPHMSPGRWSASEGRAVPFPGSFTDPKGRRFVPTGDLGRIVEGELVVVDRLKDVIAARGRKVHAVDVEHAVLEAGADVLAAAAFAIPGRGEERLVVLCELAMNVLEKTDLAPLAASLRTAVSAAVGLAAEVGLLHHGALPRTTSGKIRRQTARQAYLAGGLGSRPAEARTAC